MTLLFIKSKKLRLIEICLCSIAAVFLLRCFTEICNNCIGEFAADYEKELAGIKSFAKI